MQLLWKNSNSALRQFIRDQTLVKKQKDLLHTMIQFGIMEFFHIDNNEEYKLAGSDHLAAGERTAGKVVFADSWDGFFDKFDFKSFDDFFDYSGGKIINKNNKRTVSVLTLGDSPDLKSFFM